MDVQAQVQKEGWPEPRWLRVTQDMKTGFQRHYEGEEKPVKRLRTRLWFWLRRKRRPTYVEWHEIITGPPLRLTQNPPGTFRVELADTGDVVIERKMPKQ